MYMKGVSVRCSLRAVLACFALTFAVSAGGASAAVVDDVGVALKSSHVFVSQGSIADPSAVSAALQGQLDDSDHIVLVMLPSGSGSAPELARQIDDKTGNRYIVGLAVGNDLAASAKRLPQGVADELMHKSGVLASSSPVDALGTFVRLVQEWQTANPEPVAPSSDGGQGGRSMLLVAAIAMFAVAGLLMLVLTAKWRSETSRLRHSPEKIRHQLEKILEINAGIRDSNMRMATDRLVTDLEEFAKRFGGTDTYNTGDLEFKLENVVKILDQYAQVEQQDQRYINPDESGRVKQVSLECITGFDGLVVDSIRDGNSLALVEFDISVESLKLTP